MTQAQTLSDLAGVPHLALQRREHPEQAERQGWFGGQAPHRQIALGQERQVVPLPLREPALTQDTAVGKPSAQPEAVQRGGGPLDGKEGGDLDDRVAIWKHTSNVQASAGCRGCGACHSPPL